MADSVTASALRDTLPGQLHKAAYGGVIRILASRGSDDVALVPLHILRIAAGYDLPEAERRRLAQEAAHALTLRNGSTEG